MSRIVAKPDCLQVVLVPEASLFTSRLKVFLLERPKGVVWVLPRLCFFHFFGSFSGPLFGALFHDFWAQNGPQNRSQNGPKISRFLSSR